MDFRTKWILGGLQLSMYGTSLFDPPLTTLLSLTALTITLAYKLMKFDMTKNYTFGLSFKV